jgi:hypothetical protein
MSARVDSRQTDLECHPPPVYGEEQAPSHKAPDINTGPHRARTGHKDAYGMVFASRTRAVNEGNRVRRPMTGEHCEGKVHPITHSTTITGNTSRGSTPRDQERVSSRRSTPRLVLDAATARPFTARGHCSGPCFALFKSHRSVRVQLAELPRSSEGGERLLSLTVEIRSEGTPVMSTDEKEGVVVPCPSRYDDYLDTYTLSTHSPVLTQHPSDSHASKLGCYAERLRGLPNGRAQLQP